MLRLGARRAEQAAGDGDRPAVVPQVGPTGPAPRAPPARAVSGRSTPRRRRSRSHVPACGDPGARHGGVAWVSREGRRSGPHPVAVSAKGRGLPRSARSGSSERPCNPGRRDPCAERASTSGGGNASSPISARLEPASVGSEPASVGREAGAARSRACFVHHDGGAWDGTSARRGVSGKPTTWLSTSAGRVTARLSLGRGRPSARAGRSPQGESLSARGAWLRGSPRGRPDLRIRLDLRIPEASFTADLQRRPPRRTAASPPGGAKRTALSPWRALDDRGSRSRLEGPSRIEPFTAAARGLRVGASASGPRTGTHRPAVGGPSVPAGGTSLRRARLVRAPRGADRGIAQLGARSTRASAPSWEGARSGNGCGASVPQDTHAHGSARTRGLLLASAGGVRGGATNVKGATALVTGCGCRCTTSFEGSERALRERARPDRGTSGFRRRPGPETRRTP